MGLGKPRTAGVPAQEWRRQPTANAMSRFLKSCVACPRLARHLMSVRDEYPEYYAYPVPAFGDAHARLLIVGLAPGMHGANRTGRPFTGDHAGILLYRTLYKFGLASCAESVAPDDGLALHNCRITNAVKCLPPGNKPTPAEIQTCSAYLQSELTRLPEGAVMLALGGIAHSAVIRALGLRQAAFPFAHGARYDLPNGCTLLDSYHCSRYNTQTRRLTVSMFERVVGRAAKLLAAEAGTNSAARAKRR